MKTISNDKTTLIHQTSKVKTINLALALFTIISFGAVLFAAAFGFIQQPSKQKTQTATQGRVMAEVVLEDGDTYSVEKQPMPHMYVWKTATENEPLTDENRCATTDKNGFFASCGDGWYTFKLEGHYVNVFFSAPATDELKQIIEDTKPDTEDDQGDIPPEAMKLLIENKKEFQMRGYNLLNPIWKAKPHTLNFNMITSYYHFHRLRNTLDETGEKVTALKKSVVNEFDPFFDHRIDLITTSKPNADALCEGTNVACSRGYSVILGNITYLEGLLLAIYHEATHAFHADLYIKDLEYLLDSSSLMYKMAYQEATAQQIQPLLANDPELSYFPDPLCKLADKLTALCPNTEDDTPLKDLIAEFTDKGEKPMPHNVGLAFDGAMWDLQKENALGKDVVWNITIESFLHIYDHYPTKKSLDFLDVRDAVLKADALLYPDPTNMEIGLHHQKIIEEFKRHGMHKDIPFILPSYAYAIPNPQKPEGPLYYGELLYILAGHYYQGIDACKVRMTPLDSTIRIEQPGPAKDNKDMCHHIAIFGVENTINADIVFDVTSEDPKYPNFPAQRCTLTLENQVATKFMCKEIGS